MEISDDEIKRKFNLKDKKFWKLKDARKKVMENSEWKKYVTKILYRPFDIRWIFYHDALIERSRKEVMQHMLKENLSICFMRQVSLSEEYSHFLVSENIIDNRTFLSSKGIIQQAPLYLYSDGERKPNFSRKFMEFIKERYGKEPSPEEIFYYIYAVLYSPTYRKKYEEFLKRDFPRIPFVDDYEKFKKMASLGKELVELHLMKKRLPTNVKFDVQGSNLVEKVKYENEKVWINDKQYFDGVPEDIWNFYIGGYKVLDKWLKSRKKRKLESKDIETFLQIVEILKETKRIMEEIDKIEI